MDSRKHDYDPVYLLVAVIGVLFAFCVLSMGTQSDPALSDTSNGSGQKIQNSIEEERDPIIQNSDSIDAPDALPLITNYSYFRLARQGKAQLLTNVETRDEYNCQNIPETITISTEDLVSYDISEERLNVAAGTIISTIRCPDVTVIISVPSLPEALQEFINERGERVLMVHTVHGDGRVSAKVTVYEGQIKVLIDSQYVCSPVAVYPNSFRNCLSYELCHDVWPSEGKPGCFLDMENASACCYLPDTSINNSYCYRIDNNYNSIYCCMAEYRNGETTSDIFNSDYEKLGIAKHTETSYTPTDTQIKCLIEAILAYEATPLPQEVLESLCTDSTLLAVILDVNA